MKFKITNRFKSSYKELPIEIKKKAEKTLRLIADNPKHPSLHLKKIQGTNGIWEARVDRGYRMTLEICDGYYLLRNIGKHDETLGNP